jgi:predicted SAM-dependent methyltransferase
MTRLNLGCGPNRESLDVIDQDHAAWKFVDSFAGYNPDECYDFSGGIREPDGTVEAIYLGDALEHVVRYRVRTVLSECYRVLSPGGSLIVSVPDMAAVMVRFLASGEFADLIWGHQDERTGQNVFADTHKTGFTWATLTDALKEAGFKAENIKRAAVHATWYELAALAVK